MLYKFSDLSAAAQAAAISEERECWLEDFTNGDSEVDPRGADDQTFIEWFRMNDYMFDVSGSYAGIAEMFNETEVLL